MNNLKILKEVMPTELSEKGGAYKDTKAFKMLDEYVIVEHGCVYEQVENELRWPGSHKNVFYWVELINGYAVGWNENPARGWSFPVVKNSIHQAMTVEYWNEIIKYNEEIYGKQ